MVSVSPRLKDCLEDDEQDSVDPRFVFGFRSVSLDSSGYEQYEQDDHRPWSAGGDPTANRKKQRLRQSSQRLEQLETFQYRTCADGNLFRLFELYPGVGGRPVEGRLSFEHSNRVERDYTCLSYCWGDIVERPVDIVCDGFKLPVTSNLLAALQCLRKPKSSFYIWCDQLCINQADLNECSRQVAIMHDIFSQAKDVIVWLGEEDDKSGKLCEYARKMRRGEDSPKQTLKRILTPRQLQDAIQKLLQRPWFQRVWTIPEVANARFTIVQIGNDQLSWDNFVRLIKDVPLPPAGGFDKQAALLGNPRQRIAILSQMSASQKAGLRHTDITQLLILGKASKASFDLDYVYAFYGLTWLRTFPDYQMPTEVLYAEIIQYYVNSIRWDASYSNVHDLSEDRRTHQLMSVLYSAGALHQHYTLPSWIPDWTFGWHLAPIWCRASSNIVTASGKDEWSAGVRCDFRAGGRECGEFDVLPGPFGMHKLRVSLIIFDTITITSETTPASTPGAEVNSAMQPDPTMRYGRAFLRTAKGYIGLATPGIEAGDDVAVLLGGDVPVVIRPCGNHDPDTRAYKLLCETFLLDEGVMHGDIVRETWPLAEDVVFL
ncbi:uncharacterized protein LTR77_001267 [Saxophila tyrrhenica]|uniref:Heterokaryon incompatibility domain-containing protein n=1 Tax=Saxophila tyrrhenica TaxID=1690608 RepID=A0AAV9PPE6_9PEZI|nr:hypothetical protein LTR77_001267 [Saxophila tyrrhenica]